MMKTIETLGNIVILQVNIEVQHSICNLKSNLPNEIPVVFHNGLNYDYHFIIRELANEFEGQCHRENTEKYKTFSVPIER